mgnify:FL=1
MNTKVRYGALMLLLGLMLSCSSGNEQKQTEQAIATDEFQTFKIDTEAKPVSVFELIEEVEIMRLEETDESLLSNVQQLYSTEDRIIFPNSRAGSVYSFTKNGEFISQFRHVGNGPGEYEFIWDFWVAGDTIFLHDINRNYVMSYDLEGDHLKSWKPMFYANSFYSYGEGFVADLDIIPFQDTLQFDILFLDKDMGVKKMANPYLLPMNIAFGNNINTFKPYGENLIYHAFKSDTVFLIENYESRPLLKFDFGEEWLWTEDIRENAPNKSDLVGTAGLVWWVDSYVGEKWVYVSYKTSMRDKFSVLIDRNSGAVTNVRANKNAANKYSMSPIKMEGDRLMVSLESQDVREFMQDLGEVKVKFREGTTLEEIEASENPVLMWVKFKSLIK